LPDNAGPNIDGPRKIQGLTLKDLTIADQIARPDNAGHDNDGPNCVAALVDKL